MKATAPCIGLRQVRAHDTDEGPAFVLVVAPPDPRGMSDIARARACRDNAPAMRRDRRDTTEEPRPC